LESEQILFQQLGLALLLGLLVGLQRERTATPMAGLRTFPLITLFGTVSAILSGPGVWMVAAGVIALGIVISVVFFVQGHRRDDPERGTTTTMAILLMYAVGALLVVAPVSVGIVIGSGVAILLQFKPELHLISHQLGDKDLKAIMQFVLITCIILPILPNKNYGPLNVLNPFEIWLMVVLIVGMSLTGYILYKLLGQTSGIFLGGLLGGIISSTATTVSYAQRARESDYAARLATVVIMIASTIVYGRVLVEVVAVGYESQDYLIRTIVPICVLMVLTLVPALIVWLRLGEQKRLSMPEQENPTQLKSALVFGLMYAIVLFALALAKKFFGGQGLHAIAAISGLTDMDAITLSTSRMAMDDPSIAREGWQLIVIGALANVVFKVGIAGVVGGRKLLTRIVPLFSVPVIGGILMLAFWHSL